MMDRNQILKSLGEKFSDEMFNELNSREGLSGDDFAELLVFISLARIDKIKKESEYHKSNIYMNDKMISDIKRFLSDG